MLLDRATEATEAAEKYAKQCAELRQRVAEADYLVMPDHEEALGRAYADGAKEKEAEALSIAAAAVDAERLESAVVTARKAES